MPRKAKITAVPVEQVVTHLVADSSAQSLPEELKTDAEQMTDIINEVNTTETILQSEYEPTTPVVHKVKAKRAPSRGPSVRSLKTPVEKPNVIEPVVEVQPAAPSLAGMQPDVTLPAEEVKVDAKVECPDCGKMMSQKTLRYSHGPNCVSKKQNTMTDDNTQSVSDERVELEVQRRLYGGREERATRREAMVAKLVQNAF